MGDDHAVARLGARGIAVAVATAVVLAVVAGVLLIRPGDPGPTAPGAAERQAAALADVVGRPLGAAAVDVGAGRDLRGYAYVATVVTLATSATADEVAAIVAGLPAQTSRAGLPASYAYRKLTFVTTGGARMTVAWQAQVDVDAVRRAVGGWLAVARTLAGRADVAAILLTGGDISFRLVLGVTVAGDVLGAYDAAAAQVAPQLASDSTGALARVQWDVSGTAGPMSLRLSSTGPLDLARRRTWIALLAETARVGDPLVSSRLDVSFRDRVEAHLAVLAPDQVDDAGFTPAAFGAQVWPAVRPQLTTLVAATDHWSYFLSWAHRSRPASEQLLALLFGDGGRVRDATGKDRSPFASAGWAAGARSFLRGR